MIPEQLLLKQNHCLTLSLQSLSSTQTKHMILTAPEQQVKHPLYLLIFLHHCKAQIHKTHFTHTSLPSPELHSHSHHRLCCFAVSGSFFFLLIQRFAEKICAVKAEVKLSRWLRGFTCTRDCPGISCCWRLAAAPSPSAASE